MRVLMIAGCLGLFAASVSAEGVYGVWQSEKNDEGKYVHIEVHPCASSADQVCGTITGAFGGANEDSIGKAIIWDMTPDGANSWDDGKIWKADDDEVYSSKMTLDGDVLSVSGCILGGLICKSQDWPRVE